MNFTVNTHKSLVNNYLNDYIRLTHELYPSFLTKLNSIYYSLNLQSSNISDNFQSFYKDINDANHGGRYDVIYNIPIHLVTNSSIQKEAKEKGITTIDSTSITCNIDPLINIIPKEGDLLSFNTNIYNNMIYRIENIELSSTMRKPYNKLSIKLVPNITNEKMKKFIISEKAFINNYHYIFEKGDVLMIIELQKCIDKYIEYFNEIYDNKIDAHIDNNQSIFLEFEKAFNDMISTYNAHTQFLKINRSHLCDNLLSYYNDNNPFRDMLDPNSPKNNINNISYTSNIKRLEKNRKRMLNNRYKIYRLLFPETSKNDKLLIDINAPSVHYLNLPEKYINIWNKIINNIDFLNNVHEELSRYITNDCNIISKNMFENAIKLSQIFYIINYITSKKINRIMNINPNPIPIN